MYFFLKVCNLGLQAKNIIDILHFVYEIYCSALLF